MFRLLLVNNLNLWCENSRQFSKSNLRTLSQLTHKEYKTELRSTVKVTPSSENKNKILSNNFRLGQLSQLAYKKHITEIHTTTKVTVPPTTKNTNEIQNDDLPFPDWRLMPSTSKSELLKQYSMLSKIPMTTIVVLSSMVGYAIAPAPFDWATFSLCSIATGLISGSSGSMNQFNEVPFDAQTSRTKDRVLVCGRLTPLHAIGFAAVTSFSGLAILYLGINSLTALLGLSILVLYPMIYTPLKRVTILHSWIGCTVDGLPPLMGWAACTGTIDVGAFLIAGLFFSWQFVRFNANSWKSRDVNSRTGYRMMSVVNPDLCRRVTLRHSALIHILCCAAPIMDITNWSFLLEATPINAYFIYLAYRFYKNSTSETAKKLYNFSLVHMSLLMLLFLINKKKWYTNDKAKED